MEKKERGKDGKTHKACVNKHCRTERNEDVYNICIYQSKHYHTAQVQIALDYD